MVIAPQSVRLIDGRRCRISGELTRERVEKSPEYHPSMLADHRHVERQFQHRGLSREQAAARV